MIRDELYRDARRRLIELNEKKVIYVSDGTPGSDVIADLLAFSRGALPALIDLFESWMRETEPASPKLEEARFKLAMDVLHKPIDQGVLGLMQSLAFAADD